MPLNKLEFPEPYKHEHPSVCDVDEICGEHITYKQRAADWIARTVGSWNFIIWQTIIFGAWAALNVSGWFYRWDPYPFVLMNLVLSLEAAYAASIIMISQNREDERDRVRMCHNCMVNEKAEEEIRIVLEHLEAQDKALSVIYEELQGLSERRRIDVRGSGDNRL